MKKIIRLTESELKEIINNKLAQTYGGNPRSYPSGEQWTMGEEIKKEDDVLKQLKLKWKMEDWFTINILDNMIEKTYPHKPNSTYYIDKNTGQIYMEYNKKNKYLSFNDEIWSYFEDNYSYNYKKIKQLIDHLAAEYLGLFDIIPEIVNTYQAGEWENI